MDNMMMFTISHMIRLWRDKTEEVYMAIEKNIKQFSDSSPIEIESE